MNPQIRFGEDLMSRVSYIMMNPGGEEKLITAVRQAMNELIAEVAEKARSDLTDIVEMTVVGNPIMQHLVLGISPVELGTAPFALATDSSVDVRAAEIGISLSMRRSRLCVALHRRACGRRRGGCAAGRGAASARWSVIDRRCRHKR